MSGCHKRKTAGAGFFFSLSVIVSETRNVSETETLEQWSPDWS